MCGAKQTDPHARKPKSRGNGQGTVYKITTEGGKVMYRAVVTVGYYVDSDGVMKRKTISRRFEKKRDAMLALPDMIASKGNTPRKAPTLSDLYSRYINSRDYSALSKSQQDKLGYAWKRLSPLHLRKIDSLTVEDLQNVIEDATETYYPARDMKVLLSHLYGLAIKGEYVQYNKTEWIDLPPKTDKPPEAFDDSELTALWADYNSTGDLITAYILIMIYSGMRYGELAAMKKVDVHLDTEYPYMVGGEKTDAGRNREMPIASKILSLVQRAYDNGTEKLLEMNEDNFRKLYWGKVDGLGIRHLPPL